MNKSKSGILTPSDNSYSPLYETVNKVTNYLAQNYKEDKTLDELGELFHINKYYLTRIFRQVTGLTIVEYLQIQRVQIARELLKSGQLPVTEIAMIAGFSSVSYFEKIFKRYMNMTPIQYRKYRKKLAEKYT